MWSAWDDLVEDAVALALTPSYVTASFWAGMFFVCMFP